MAQATALPLLALPMTQAQAQFRVEVSGVGMTQIPFSAASFRGNGAVNQDMAAIIRADLERSGQFRFVEPLAGAFDENTTLDYAPWRSKTSDAVVTGSVNKLADDRYDVRFRLWDIVGGKDLGGLSFPVTTSGLRNAAHKIADYIYEKLTGDKGAFSTRIAYVARNGRQHTLFVADADGESAQAAMSSTEPIISPAWSGDGGQLAYVSFENSVGTISKAKIYAQNIANGNRRLWANFRGTNSSPNWSPDGSRMVATLSLAGGSQIYLLNSSGGTPTRLTQTTSIDAEPVFSADGSSIYFVSDRGGSPQIYRMGAGGGSAQRITFNGNYNISPAPSPDGRWLAFISRVGGAFRLHVMDLSSGTVSAVSETSADENPSFAPNSKLIIYATRDRGQEALMTSTLDGRIKTRLATARGDIREPSWGPFSR